MFNSLCKELAWMKKWHKKSHYAKEPCENSSEVLTKAYEHVSETIYEIKLFENWLTARMLCCAYMAKKTSSG